MVLWVLLTVAFAQELPKLSKINFSYGTLQPMFDPNTNFYTLAVPKCEDGWNYHLLPLNMQVETGNGIEIMVRVGHSEESQMRSLNVFLAESSGLQEYNFQGLTVEIDLKDPNDAKAPTNVFKVTLKPTLTDDTLVKQKCLYCPAPKDHPRPYTCNVEHSTLLGGSCTCNSGYEGHLKLDADTRIFSGVCVPKISCTILHATLNNKNCTCDAGYMGVLTLNPKTYTFTGSCPKIPPPKPTPPPRPPRGRWPCEGVTPYTCHDCPTCDEASRIMMDLEKSCNIPDDMGTGGLTYAAGSGYMPRLVDFGPEYKMPDGRPDRIIYHTYWSRVSRLNKKLHQHLCISPICRWRIEMAFNAFANCQTEEAPHADDVVHWRNYTDFTMHTMKHIILLMESAKTDCHNPLAPSNVFVGAELYQTYRIHGIDTRTDATLRQAELAFRQAFSNILDYPLRKLNVRIEGEPHPECPLAFDAPVCKKVDCGYGQCIPSGDGTSSYVCLCNQCYEQGRTSSGHKTCVRKENCKILDPCAAHPCHCGGRCRNCPDCPGPRKYTCTCQLNFSGPQCDKLTCPPGFDHQSDVGEDGCGVCIPREGTNMCDPNPCQNAGVCVVSDNKKHGFLCECSGAYTGRICQTMNCPEGTEVENGICVHSFEKKKKKVVANPCAPNPCANGFCIPRGPTQYQCQCPNSGYKGKNCEIKVDVCQPSPCDVGYTCHSDENMASGYRCTCPDCEKHMYDSKGRRKENDATETNYRRLEEIKHGRRLEDAPIWVQYDWENSEAIPEILPLPKNFPKSFNPLHERSKHCRAYQNSQHMGSELILTVKCPVDSGKGDCDKLAKKLSEFYEGSKLVNGRPAHPDAVTPLERRVQWNCIAAKITGVTEPHEELQISNCPSHREFNFRWHAAYQECNFQSLGMAENAVWQLYISQDGVETADPKYQHLFCTNPVCRALILDMASLYKECPNSSPNVMGYCSRKAKALRNSVKACSNPTGVVVLRQQLQIQGVVDPMSNKELLAVEEWILQEVIEKTGAPKDRTKAHVQPILHVNDWQSRVYPTFNSIYPAEIQPQRGFAPDSVYAGLDETPHATTCQGLCIKTLQPGKSNHGIDPMSSIYATWSEPIRIGQCLAQGSCKVTLTPDKSSRGHYVLNNDEFSPRAELVASGETLGLFPRLSLKPFTNYTCRIDAGVVQSATTGAASQTATFWFMTGKPRDSSVKISISIGCDDQMEYDGYAGYMPDFHGAIEETLLNPVRKVLHKLRQEEGVSVRRLAEENLDEERVKIKNAVKDVRAEMYAQAMREPIRDLASSEPPGGSSAQPTPEVRETIPCTTQWSWWIFSWLILIPIILCVVAVWCASRAFEPWIQDVLREGIGTNCSYTRMTDGGYRSKSVENRDSLSYKLGGPLVYTLVLCVVGLLLSAAFGVFWAWMVWGSGDNSIYYIGALFAMAMCAMVWAVWVAVIATWVNPGQLPFFRDSKSVSAMKWSENVPRSKMGPPCFLDIDFAAESYTSTMVESDTKPEKVTVTVFRDVVQDGARPPSRMTIPLKPSQNAARCAFYLATLVFFAVLFLFTALAMQLCPKPSVINFIFFCILSGLFYALLGIVVWWLLVRKHCWHSAISVLYKPVREIKKTTKPNIVYEEAKEFLAHDIIFEEGTRFVKKLVVSPESPARAEHIRPGMELVQIKALVPIGLGSPVVEFVGTSGEQGDARRLLNNFEERFRHSRGQRSDAFGEGSSNPKNVDIVLTFKHAKVQYTTPVY